MDATARHMNNAAVELFLEGKKEESFDFYKRSLSLLTEAAQGSISTSSLYEARQKIPSQLSIFSTSVIDHLDQPVQLPCSESMQTPDSTAALIVMYNLFLLLRQSGKDQNALSFLGLVQSLMEEEFDETKDLHPTFRMSIRCHLAEMAYDCGAVEDAWRYFIEAIEIGEGSESNDVPFATVCTRMGHLLLREGYRYEAQEVYLRASRIYDHLPISPTSMTASGSSSYDDQVDECNLPCETMTAAAA